MVVGIMGFRGIGEEAPLFAGYIWWDVYINGNPVVDLLKVPEAVQRGGNDFC